MTGKVDFLRIFEFVRDFFWKFLIFRDFFDIKGYFFIKNKYFLYIWGPQGPPNRLGGPGDPQRISEKYFFCNFLKFYVKPKIDLKTPPNWSYDKMDLKLQQTIKNIQD